MCTCVRVCVMCVRIYVHVFACVCMLCVYIGHRDLFKQALEIARHPLFAPKIRSRIRTQINTPVGHWIRALPTARQPLPSHALNSHIYICTKINTPFRRWIGDKHTCSAFDKSSSNREAASSFSRPGFFAWDDCVTSRINAPCHIWMSIVTNEWVTSHANVTLIYDTNFPNVMRNIRTWLETSWLNYNRYTHPHTHPHTHAHTLTHTPVAAAAGGPRTDDLMVFVTKALPYLLVSDKNKKRKKHICKRAFVTTVFPNFPSHKKKMQI